MAILSTVQLAKASLIAAANKLRLARNIDWSHSDKFGVMDNPIGETIVIKRPVYSTVVDDNMAFTSGAGAVNQGKVHLTVNSTATAFLTFSEMQVALQGSESQFLKDFGPSIGSQMASRVESRLYNAISNAGTGLKSTAFTGSGSPVLAATDIQTVTQPGAQWLVYGSGVTAGVASPSHATPGALTPGDMFKISAILDDAACPSDDRYAVLSPTAMAFLADSASKYFNPQTDASKAFREGVVGTIGDIEMSASQVVGTHTNGAWAGTIRTDTTAIAAYSSVWLESGSLTFTGVTVGASFNAGDMFTVGGGGTGIFWCNPLTKQSNGQLIQFNVVTAVASAAGTTQVIECSPKLITSGPDQNCVIITKASETVTLLGAPSTTYQESVVFHKKAIAGAAPKLFVPDNKTSSYARLKDMKIGLRFVSDYDTFGAAAGNNGVPKAMTRMDMVFGIKVTNGERCVRIRTAVLS